MKKILAESIVKLFIDGGCSSLAIKQSSVSRISSIVPQGVDGRNPKVAKTKGNRQGGRPSKHLERFIYKREALVPKARV